MDFYPSDSKSAGKCGDSKSGGKYMVNVSNDPQVSNSFP